MNKTEIRKIVEKDLLEFFDAKTLLSNNQILMELCIDSTLKAINYTRCSLQLKDKEKMSFGQWKFSQGLRYISDHTYRNAKGELFDADVVNKTYDDYYNL
jgi:hypothetical protein